MADFTGMTVQVTLKQSNAVLHGKVVEVVAGQTLTLQDAFVPATGAILGVWTVESTAVADLQVIDANPTPTSAIRTNAPAFPPQLQRQQGLMGPRPPQQQALTGPRPPQQPQTSTGARPPLQHPQPQLPPQRQPSTFVDPAILSYGKSPAASNAPQPPVEAPATPVKSMLAKAAESLPVNGSGSPFVAEPGSVRLENGRKTSRAQQESPQVTRVAPPAKAAAVTQDGTQDAAEEQGQAETGNKKRVRRGQKKKAASGATPSSDVPPVMNIEVSRNGNDMNGGPKRGKGWRQTPLLQPSPGPVGQQHAGKKQTRRQRDQESEMQQNGWATEDATDVQDMGDFDFEASNKLFDKKTVFDELRQGDTTADEDRLVNHNKLARPGTHGGKNLHPTESVLSPKVGSIKHGSHQADSTSDADTELNLANGRSSSRHSVTRSLLGKKVPSRQNTAQVDGKHPHPLTASMSSDRGSVGRSVAGLPIRSRPAASHITTSPLPDRLHSPQSAVSFSKSAAPLSATAPDPHFVIQHTLSVCPVLHPSALDTLEMETISRFGLTREAVTETAARAIAEAAMSTFDPFSGSRRGSRANTVRGSMTSSMTFDRTQTPVIVILAGNHAVGARAIAAARHLSSRKTRVIIAEALYESKETQDVQMRTQTSMLKRLQRAGHPIKRGGWRKALEYIKNLTGPPAVIIDALLAGSTYESLLDSNAQHAADSQKEVREMIDWANRSRAPVLSIACPSGVSGRDGSATLVEGEPLAVRPEKVLSLAAPMQGLLAAMGNGERWDVSLADIGLNITLRSEEAVGFGAQWVVELRFVEDEGVLEVA